jgi:hypothetical protein
MNGKRDDAAQPSRSNVIRIDFTNDDETNEVIDCIKNINWKKNVLSFSSHFSWMGKPTVHERLFHFSIIKIVFEFVLFRLAARFMVLSLFATVHGWVIWLACLAHLVPILVLHKEKNYCFMDSLRLSFLHVFAYLYRTKKNVIKRNTYDSHLSCISM